MTNEDNFWEMSPKEFNDWLDQTENDHRLIFDDDILVETKKEIYKKCYVTLLSGT